MYLSLPHDDGTYTYIPYASVHSIHYDGGTKAEVQTKDGVRRILDRDQVERLVDPVVGTTPAAEGTYVLVPPVDDVSDDLSCAYLPVIAWSLRASGHVDPVTTYYDHSRYNPYAILYPDGRLEEPYYRAHASVEALLASWRERYFSR